MLVGCLLLLFRRMIKDNHGLLWVAGISFPGRPEQVARLATRGQPGIRVGAGLALCRGWV